MPDDATNYDLPILTFHQPSALSPCQRGHLITMAMPGDERYPFDWAELAPRLIHPAKVAIIESVARIGRPLSTRQLAKIFDGRFCTAQIAYHARGLVDAGALEGVERRPVGGAVETFLYFRSPS